MFIYPILLLLFAVWLIPFLFRGGSYVSNQTPTHQNAALPRNTSAPIEVLNFRYAKGEISEEEYHKIKKNLEF